MKKVLTIAGSDSSGGAGIQADLKTMEAHGVFGMSAITALTAQNTRGVNAIMNATGDFLKEQIKAVFEDIEPDAVKIGMLPNVDTIEATAESLQKYHPKWIVLDPVLVATSGASLSERDAKSVLKAKLFPLATVITPNMPEAEALSGREIHSKQDMEEIAKQLGDTYGCAVLLKGGHNHFAEMEGEAKRHGGEGESTSEEMSPDYLYIPTEKRGVWINGRRIENPNTHGTGCTLSSAIACNLALGYDLEKAVRRAKHYIEACIAYGLNLGFGRGPLHHSIHMDDAIWEDDI